MKETKPTINHGAPEVHGWAFKYQKTSELNPEDVEQLKDKKLYMKAVDGVDEKGHLKLVDDLSSAYIVLDSGDDMLRVILQGYAEAQGFELVPVPLKREELK